MKSTPRPDTTSRAGPPIGFPRRTFANCAAQLRHIANRPFVENPEAARQEVVSLCVEARALYERHQVHRHPLCVYSASVRLLVANNQPANAANPEDATWLRELHFAAWQNLAINLATRHTDLLPGGVLIGGAEYTSDSDDGRIVDGAECPIDWIDGVKYPLARWRQMAREFAEVCEFLEVCASQLSVGSLIPSRIAQQQDPHYLRPKDIRLYITVDGTSLFKRAKRGDIRRQAVRSGTKARPVWHYSLVDVIRVWGGEPSRTSGMESLPWSSKVC